MTYSVVMPKQKLTLYADGDLIERMKVRAIREKRSLSVITEEFYKEYLKRKGKPKIKI